MKQCQLCGGALFSKPAITLHNQPKSVLYFPEPKDFKSDKGITIKVYQCQMCGLLQHTLPPIPNPIQNISPKLKEQREQWIRDWGRYCTGRPDFVSFNELEHFPNIGAVIKDIYAIYDKILITVPNFRYLNEICADHLYYFTPADLELAFKINGFDKYTCQRINEDNDILFCGYKRENKSPVIWCPINWLKKMLQNQIKGIKNIKRSNSIAMWGAGHRCLSLLAEGKIKVDYLVDSTPSKQGKYTPVTHIPIYSEEHLISHPVDVVIITVPETYKDEVLAKAESMPIKSRIAFIGEGLEWIK